MDFDFTSEEIIFIYGHFKKEIKKLTELKNLPNSPISHKSINVDIDLYSSITNKIEKCCPRLNKLNSYL
ncbi:hypothetical protein [Clostridium hydrogeniformans]|uniref:hypothetical protein n=1 Tax=Clostridium hydrogeniformans TaxID=349933 RepID=UPI000485BF2D|nr:hypothetical protein [Clostridium hydrogeniformans]